MDLSNKNGGSYERQQALPTQPALHSLVSPFNFLLHCFHTVLKGFSKTFLGVGEAPWSSGRQLQLTLATSALLTFHGIEREAGGTWERGSCRASRQGAARRGGGHLFFLVLNFSVHYDAAVLGFRVRFGFRGGCWLRGPVGVHAEFLGQVHVSRLGCHVARAAQPGKALGRMPVDSLLRGGEKWGKKK